MTIAIIAYLLLLLLLLYNLFRPAYDFPSKYNIPSALFAGGQDDLADPADVYRIKEGLRAKGLLVAYKVIDSYSHMDFTWGYDAADYVYPDAIKLIKQYIG